MKFLELAKRELCFAMLSLLFVSVAAASEKYSLWREYTEAGSLEQKDRAYWAKKLENAAGDLTIPWRVRQVYKTEAAVLYQGVDAEKSKENWDALYSEAVQRNDKRVQVKALDNMISRLMRPSNEEKLQEALNLYSKYQEVLSNPPKGYEKKFQQDLADSFLRRGRLFFETSKRIKEFEGLSKDELSAPAVRDFKVFYDLGNFKHQHKSLALFELAGAYANNGQEEKAVTFYKRLAKQPDSMVAPSRAMWKAIELEYPERVDRIEPMEKVLAEFEPGAYWNQFKQLLLFEYLKAERWDKAIKIASQITDTGESNKVSAYNMFLLATALRRSGRLDEAERVLQIIQQKYPDTGTAKELASREERIIEDQKNEIYSQVDHIIDMSIDSLIDIETKFQEITDKTQEKLSVDQDNLVQKQSVQPMVAKENPTHTNVIGIISTIGVGVVLTLGCMFLMFKLKKNKTTSQASNNR